MKWAPSVRALIFPITLVAAWLATASVSHSQIASIARGGEPDAVNLQIKVIKASNDGSGVDNALDDLKDRFANLKFDSYRLVESRKLTLGPSIVGTVGLPNNKVLQMRQVRVDHGRARMTVTVSDVLLKVSLANGGTVILGGLDANNGEILVAISANF